MSYSVIKSPCTGLLEAAALLQSRFWRSAWHNRLPPLSLWSGEIVSYQRVTQQSIGYLPRDSRGKPASNGAGWGQPVRHSVIRDEDTGPDLADTVLDRRLDRLCGQHVQLYIQSDERSSSRHV